MKATNKGEEGREGRTPNRENNDKKRIKIETTNKGEEGG